MASSSSAGNGENIASMFENCSKWLERRNIGVNDVAPVKLLSLTFVDCMEARSKSMEERDCAKEWQLLSSTIDNYKTLILSFVTLWAKKTSTDASIYFEVNPEFIKNLEELSPSFHVEGSVISVKRQNYNYDDLQRTCTVSYNGELESGRGELFQEAGPGGFVEFMTSQGSLWKFQITWSLSIKWSSKNKSLKLGMDSVLAKMYSCEETKDLTIIVGNGAEVKCHKFIFAAHSSVLAAMIAPESGMQEAKTARVELKDLSEEGIGLLLPYFYGMELPISSLNCDVAVELFQAAHKYGLTELETELEKVILKKDSDWLTANALVELYYFSRNVDKFKNLEKHTLKVMTGIPDEMKECDRYKELEQAEQLSLMWVLVSYMSTLLRAHPC